MRPGAAGDTGYPFNDELLPMQWHLINRGNLFGDKSIVDADVQCEEAWKSSTGDKSIIVAVLDEGVMVEHPDLKNSMWVNEGEVYRSKQDNDGNGYKGDVYGYNFVFETGVISWDDINDTGHGTHVAGVIAAQNNNGIGISSIAGGNADIPGVKIMSCQIFSGNTVSNSLATVRAIKYAADNGAVILQCSWGYVSGSANSYEWGAPGFKDEEEWATNAPLEKDALDYFLHNAGRPTARSKAAWPSSQAATRAPRRPGSRRCRGVHLGIGHGCRLYARRLHQLRPRHDDRSPGRRSGLLLRVLRRQPQTRRDRLHPFDAALCHQRNGLRLHGRHLDGLPPRFGVAALGSRTPHSSAATSRPTSSRHCSAKPPRRSTPT